MYLWLLSGKESACQCMSHKRRGFDPYVGKIPWRRACNPLWHSCLENPMDRGAWWATQRVGRDWACMHSYHSIQHFHFYLFKAHDNIGLLNDLYSNVHMGLSLYSEKLNQKYINRWIKHYGISIQRVLFTSMKAHYWNNQPHDESQKHYAK